MIWPKYAFIFLLLLAASAQKQCPYDFSPCTCVQDFIKYNNGPMGNISTDTNFGFIDVEYNPFDCDSDPFHLAWILRDNRHLLRNLNGTTCNGTDGGEDFGSLTLDLFESCDPEITSTTEMSLVETSDSSSTIIESSTISSNQSSTTETTETRSTITDSSTMPSSQSSSKSTETRSTITESSSTTSTTNSSSICFTNSSILTIL